jgi:raffinose/stachyose/melibiose transport system permease protein
VNRYRPRTFLLELLMVAAGVAFLFPVYALIVLSLKDSRQISASPLGLPSPPTLHNYSAAWSDASLGGALLSSTLVTVVSLVLLVAVGSCAAYFLARTNTRLGYGMYVLFLLGIVLYTGFIRALPPEYAAAALVDGASHAQAYTRIVFPLLRPITGTVLILNAVFIWNDFFTPLLYLSGSDHETVPVRIFAFVGQYVSDYGLVFAGLVLGAIPILVVFLVLQRYVIKGFASGLKG